MLGVFLVTVNPHNSSSQLILYLLANSDNTFIPASYAVILFSLIKSSIFASIKLVAKGLAGSPPLTRERLLYLTLLILPPLFSKPPMRRSTLPILQRHSKYLSKPPMRRSTVRVKWTACAVISKPPMRRSTICRMSAISCCFSKPPMRRSTYRIKHLQIPSISKPPMRRSTLKTCVIY